jgi:hypothetical protein
VREIPIDERLQVEWVALEASAPCGRTTGVGFSASSRNLDELEGVSV